MRRPLKITLTIIIEILLNAITRRALDIGLNKKDIIGPAALGNKLDWIGVNYYTRAMLKRKEPGPYEIFNFEGVPGWHIPDGVSKSGRGYSESGLEFYPEGLTRVIEIAKRYSENIYITENGVVDARDIYRPQYYYIVNHLYIVVQLIERGVKAKAHLYWALTDNYEWAVGFRDKFGLFEVDLATKQRIPRRSAKIYGEIARTKRISNKYLEKYPKFINDTETYPRYSYDRDHILSHFIEIFYDLL